ncbi:protein-tyrosine phosphatase-like protein [Dipodascopsis tothii]|uniref:protein-tyrosine phosphatase-like protein n=1 Tax=Dipodascopsis tothii TaxID=44089 RepID=UPI0034CE3665
MAMHKIVDHVYLGSMFALKGKLSIEQAGITHILSVLRGPIEANDVLGQAGMTHKQISLDDDEDENIIEHFGEALEFMDAAVSKGESVLVHCMAGVSRSATVVAAYLIWKERVSAETALARIRAQRAVANPNESFLEQLEIYARGIGQSTAPPALSENVTEYRRWLLQRQVAAMEGSGQAPVPRYAGADETATAELRCKKCRCALARSNAVVVHEGRHGLVKNARVQQPAYASKIGPGMVSLLAPQCMHYFLEPVRWMQPELDKGALEGRLECPKCRAKVGSYRWQGMKCTCGEWVTPGIEVQRGRVDEIRLA